MRLPRMYAPVTIEFWSLRYGLGFNLGVVFDIDTLVRRNCRRVRVEGGWKWQIINYYKNREWDHYIETDQEILDNYLHKLEFTVI